MTQEVLKKSASEQAQLLREKQISSKSLVEAHIDQIQAINPKINALVENCFDQARSEAQKADALIERISPAELAQKFPLLGVPFTAKEFFAVPQMKSTLGLKQRVDHIKNENSSVIQKLQNAGAILLGKTNIPEMGFWWECENPVYGRTKNPYNLGHTSGGSSGGEASIVSAYGSAFGVGSDVGGSIRVPASFCGIFGHKASNKIIAQTGHHPLYQKNAWEYRGNKYPHTSIGPMARSADDLVLLTQLMVGPDGFDREVDSNYKYNVEAVDWKNTPIFILPQPKIFAVSKTHSDIENSVRNAGLIFQEAGATVTELNADFFQDAFELWTAGMKLIEGPSFAEILKNERQMSFIKELFKFPFKKSEFTLPSIITALLETATQNEKMILNSQKKLEKFKINLQKKLGSNGILILPTAPLTAPQHHHSLLRPFDFVMSGIFCVTGNPATQAPAGISEKGLPYGIQFVASPMNDHLTLQATQLFASKVKVPGLQ